MTERPDTHAWARSCLSVERLCRTSAVDRPLRRGRCQATPRAAGPPWLRGGGGDKESSKKPFGWAPTDAQPLASPSLYVRERQRGGLSVSGGEKRPGGGRLPEDIEPTEVSVFVTWNRFVIIKKRTLLGHLFSWPHYLHKFLSYTDSCLETEHKFGLGRRSSQPS